LAISRVAHRGGDRRKLPDLDPSSQDLSAKFFVLTPQPRRNTLEIKEIPIEVFSKKKEEMDSMDRYEPHGRAENS
jgi:hypothetical protein